MKKIIWTKNASGSVSAMVGNMKLYCRLRYTVTSSRRWYANVYMHYSVGKLRYGPDRKSLQKAQEDAIQIAYELLLDYQAGIEKELANFE